MCRFLTTFPHFARLTRKSPKWRTTPRIPPPQDPRHGAWSAGVPGLAKWKKRTK